jgi:hypothetical protein
MVGDCQLAYVEHAQAHILHPAKPGIGATDVGDQPRTVGDAPGLCGAGRRRTSGRRGPVQ